MIFFTILGNQHFVDSRSNHSVASEDSSDSIMWNLVAKDSIMNSITGEEAKITPSTVKASSLGGTLLGPSGVGKDGKVFRTPINHEV